MEMNDAENSERSEEKHAFPDRDPWWWTSSSGVSLQEASRSLLGTVDSPGDGNGNGGSGDGDLRWCLKAPCGDDDGLAK
uniref:Uncharacterized protein n=1 Tax=Oryza glumipatula TaxID=40148 RepID=A0A0D9ZGY4_9ORYZ